MNQKIFAKEFLNCTPTHWGQVLKGVRHLCYSKAEVVADILNTPVKLWVNSSVDKSERAIFWNDFLKSADQEE